MNLTTLAGLRFNRSYRHQKFNYATGEIEPEDITGSTFEFSIYKLIEADLVMTHDKTGQKLQGTVQLSAEETAHYRRLKTDDEREAYKAQLAPKYVGQLLRKAREAFELVEKK